VKCVLFMQSVLTPLGVTNVLVIRGTLWRAVSAKVCKFVCFIHNHLILFSPGKNFSIQTLVFQISMSVPMVPNNARLYQPV
jgi:hypothetical protein